MALAKRLLSANEEHAKKSDDPHVLSPAPPSLLSRAWRGPRRKRVVILLIGLWLFYVFFKNIPTDLNPVPRRSDATRALDILSGQPQDQAKFYFDGPIKFYNLAATLHRGKGRDGNSNPNVLFAFSSLKSASNLVPMACEMSRQRRNRVHVAFMGRSEIPINVIKEINGIRELDCLVQWHDARPDYSSVSSDNRMKTSVRAGLTHLYSFVRTPVVITDTSLENDFFTSGMREMTNELGITLLALPMAGAESFRWLTKLDSTSLSFWNKVQLDILVHSNAESSASLMRLLRSLQNADYLGNPLPRLTIELPSNVDPPTSGYLSRFKWPSTSLGSDSKLTIRHRTNPTLYTPAEASLHTIEAFYPANIATSHVLILTPDAELSRSYYHYLMYSILEYKYSSTRGATADSLLGISLDLPRKGLNGSSSFTPSQSDISTPCFLWQAPNSNAALYFGDKWAEYHSFVSHRLMVESSLGKAAKSPKFVSPQYPAWLEYLLELMRARGYSMLYPAFAEMPDSSIVTIHKELYKIPEEFSGVETSELRSSDSGSSSGPLRTSGVLTADFEGRVKERVDSIPTGTGSILSLLSHGKSASTDVNDSLGLPTLAELPLLSYSAQPLTASDSIEVSSRFADEFALAHGGCKSLADRKKPEQWPADFLFCLPDLIPIDQVSGAG